VRVARLNSLAVGCNALTGEIAPTTGALNLMFQTYARFSRLSILLFHLGAIVRVVMSLMVARLTYTVVMKPSAPMGNVCMESEFVTLINNACLWHCLHARCECYAGWMGVRCEIRTKTIFIPCLPDPCLGDCHCVESCRHSNGYQCVSEGGYIGRNCSIRKLYRNSIAKGFPDNCNVFSSAVPAVSCRSSSMVVTISKRFYDEFDQGAKNSYIYISPSLANPESFSKACRGTHAFPHF